MSQLAVDGLLAERESFLAVLCTLTPDEWDAPSAEQSATVRDVVAHVASTHHRVVEPQAGEWPVEDALAEFDRYTAQSIAALGALQAPPHADRTIPMAHFGTHRMSQLADLYLYDMYGHLRADVLAPYGPVDRPEPPRDEARVRPTVEWMIDALPCMVPAKLLEPPIDLELDGPGGGTWAITRDGVIVGRSTDAAATVRSTDHEFVLWGTKRRSWREFAEVEGDATHAAKVLDAINII